MHPFSTIFGEAVLLEVWQITNGKKWCKGGIFFDDIDVFCQEKGNIRYMSDDLR